MSLTIHLDATYAVSQRPTGVANYCLELLQGLASRNPDDVFCHCFRPHRFLPSFQEDLPPNAYRSLLLDGWFPLRPTVFHGLNQRLPRIPAKRMVSTFHDLFVMTSEYSSLAFRERFTAQARDAAARSDIVCCVSSFTADQVEELLHVDRSRIRVIHHGARPPATGAVKPTEEREPVVLFVGGIQKRKNVVGLIRAFAALPAPWQLVLVGDRGYGWEEAEMAIAESPSRDRIRQLGYCDDATLRRLYQTSSLLAFPSFDEGFGLPVLEAMGWGLPVLSSNRSSIPEVAGDAALLVDPFHPDALRDALASLAADEGLRRQLAAQGLAHVGKFTWEACVDATYSVYRQLL
ncbi:MAG: glycosyltransferase family 4 protein [Bryobacterales bacterium]|jgi:glycosyltransferase involved in cell wall biosynthesis|nr:glycosyltransferase family 4 protein [Bryobacterales bacterium]